MNLNLLVALDALLGEGSVTRAAARIGLSQSAMSHNLAALRQLFDDELLVRTTEGMRPTPFAVELHAPLARVLNELSLLVRRTPDFDPATSERRFTLATADFVTARLASDMVETLVAVAPKVDLSVRALELPLLAEQLRSGAVDLAIGPRMPDDPELCSELLIEETWACALRDGHPALEQEWGVEVYAGLEHLLVSPSGRGSSTVDLALEERGLSRRIRCRVFSFMSAPPIVAGSDLALTGPQSQLRLFRSLGLRVLPLPLEIAPLPLYAVWHRRFDRAPDHSWLLRIVGDAVRASG